MSKKRGRSEDPLWEIHEWNVDRIQRELWITGEELGFDLETLCEPGVEYLMAARLAKNLRILSTESKDPILIHMKTCGGLIEEGLAIFDAIQACPCHVTILSYTHSRSMSSYILQAACNRVLMPHSYFLIHRGTFAIQDRMLPAKSAFKFNEVQARQCMDIYINQMKQKGKFKRWSRKKISDMLNAEMDKATDVYLEPAEAIAWGLADKIFDGDWKKLKFE